MDQEILENRTVLERQVRAASNTAHVPVQEISLDDSSIIGLIGQLEDGDRSIIKKLPCDFVEQVPLIKFRNHRGLEPSGRYHINGLLVAFYDAVTDSFDYCQPEPYSLQALPGKKYILIRKEDKNGS